MSTKIAKLEDLIKNSIGGELVEQTVESLLPPGENYGSVIYRVDFKVILTWKLVASLILYRNFRETFCP